MAILVYFGYSNYHKLGGLRPQLLIISNLKSFKSGYQQVYIASGDSWAENILYQFLLISGSHLHVVAYV